MAILFIFLSCGASFYCFEKTTLIKKGSCSYPINNLMNISHRKQSYGEILKESSTLFSKRESFNV